MTDSAVGPRRIKPFGAPDGTLADLDHDVFVKFDDSLGWQGLASQENDLSARVFVGKKGSGKTIYLRRLRAWAATESSLYADRVQNVPPSTEHIVRFGQWYQKLGGRVLTEKWSKLWRAAIYRSLVSHLLENSALRTYTSKDLRNQLTGQFSSLLRPFTAPVTIYSQVDDLIRSHSGAKHMSELLEHHLWAELESILRDRLHDFPTICFFLDSIDEYFDGAPMYWLRCHEGLFDQILALLRDSLGNRLHVVVCLRDVVLAAAFQGPHATRIKNDPYIRLLNWNSGSIDLFLQEKVAQLDPRILFDDRSEKSVESWLGLTEIENSRRGSVEPIRQYLVRHTRMLPRDIIQLGNDLCACVAKAKQSGSEDRLADLIRQTVASNARTFGDEQLEICANELTSEMMPLDAAKYDIVSTYTSDLTYIRGFAGDLKKVIAHIGKDRFSEAELRSAAQYAATLFASHSNVPSILWRNGLLGYVRDARDRQELFYSGSDPQMHLPLGMLEYVFHPILIDAVNIALGDHPNPANEDHLKTGQRN